MDARMKILEMLSEGIITVDEADQLLSTLDRDKVEVKDLKSFNRTLYIKIQSSDNDKVNVTIPLNILNAFKKSNSLKSFLAKSIKVDGLDSEVVDELDIDMIIEMIESGVIGELVNIESNDGDIVKVYIQ